MKNLGKYLFEGKNIYWTVITIVFIEAIITKDHSIFTIGVNLFAWGFLFYAVKTYSAKKRAIKN